MRQLNQKSISILSPKSNVTCTAQRCDRCSTQVTTTAATPRAPSRAPSIRSTRQTTARAQRRSRTPWRACTSATRCCCARRIDASISAFAQRDRALQKGFRSRTKNGLNVHTSGFDRKRVVIGVDKTQSTVGPFIPIVQRRARKHTCRPMRRLLVNNP